jgi:hypothetical protein
MDPNDGKKRKRQGYFENIVHISWENPVRQGRLS